MIDGQKRSFLKFQDVRAFLDSVLGEDIHTKRVDSLANATLGVMTGASLGVALIGKSLAQARGLLPKHAVKQVDRLLSNPRLEAWDVFASWVPEIVGPRTDIVVAMDWTDYDGDGQATLALKLVTRHGRATPLVWLSVHKDDLKDARNDYEDAGLRRLAEVLPDGVTATILAGFADTKLFEFLTELGFGYVIRLKGNTKVSAVDGTTRPAADWIGQGGRARKLRDATVTEARRPIGAAVCVHARDMKEPWCLVTSNRDATAPQIIRLYSKRWGVEPGFRDTKDLRFGLGLCAVRIADPQRRDRLLLLNAFAVVLLTLLGAAGESLGMDRHLKSNTVKTRSHSLFRQGSTLYDLIPNMPEHRLRPLIDRFAELLQQSRAFTETFAVT
jgi:Transposase DDE domain